MHDSDDEKDETYMLVRAVLTAERFVASADELGYNNAETKVWYEKLKSRIQMWRDFSDEAEAEEEEGDQ
jgi:hypothetical protein